MKFRNVILHSKWRVAAACSFIHFLTTIPTRCGGILFLAIMSCYQVDRDQASIPIVLISLTRTLGGPLAGILRQKLDLYTITTIGWILTILGVGCCFFAETLMEVIFFLGLIHGAGLGLGLPLIPQILREHFDKHFDKANGISLAGTCVGAFLMPPVIEFLLQMYGTSGTFLVLSGLILHCIPASMLLSKPESSLAKQKEFIAIIDELNTNEKEVNGNNAVPNKGNACSICLSIDESDPNLRIVDEQIIMSQNYDGIDFTLLNEFPHSGNNVKKIPEYDSLRKQEEVKLSGTNTEIETRNTTIICQSNRHRSGILGINWEDYPKIFSNKALYGMEFTKFSSPELIRWKPNKSALSRMNSKQSVLSLQIDNLEDVINSIHDRKTKAGPKSKIKLFYQKCCDFLSNMFKFIDKNKTASAKKLCLNEISEKNQYTGTVSSTTKNAKITKPMNLFFDATFLLIVFIQSSHGFIVSMMWTIIIDFCNDKGISRVSSIYILMFLPVAELIGSIGFGWITDSNYLARSKYLFICFATLGLVSASFVLSNSFIFVFIGTLAYGFLGGTLAVVFPGVIIETIDENMKELALSSRLFLYAPMSLMISPLVGYFRGSIGSYDGIFYILAILSGLCGILSLLVPIVSSAKRNNQASS